MYADYYEYHHERCDWNVVKLYVPYAGPSEPRMNSLSVLATIMWLITSLVMWSTFGPSYEYLIYLCVFAGLVRHTNVYLTYNGVNPPSNILIGIIVVHLDERNYVRNQECLHRIREQHQQRYNSVRPALYARERNRNPNMLALPYGQDSSTNFSRSSRHSGHYR